MNSKTLFFFIALLTLIFIVSCSAPSVSSEQACTQNSDCVASVCCHADSSVNKDYAPSCEGILCSADCQAGTMDCGQAVAKCLQGACTVVEI